MKWHLIRFVMTWERKQAFALSLALAQLAPGTEHPAVIKLAMQPTITTVGTLVCHHRLCSFVL
jgi:hypothetical protein